ncbi:helix-turn-helix domain-containing protein [Paenibacillus radicis (ex Xue et al. 2023)]|uniref:Helix-turn-helix domain-containing protein n=1 Tax=Paenibacillus radicis (ex Xue et al. 2023) TaxID=2972489 RepID=A0ABT1YV36_9BACL|nr:helix-turn-helix transcriptional regulator [Paenibacillus radicis (ex Xue et al. 2023)]MCR8636808.1 helix-turn-helix domain-containing protein [Paenibacillus radicis (ex Xue et al. 2023)]
MSESTLKLIGRRIRDLRKEKGLSQEQLGELANLNYTYIGGVERAETNISVLNLTKIAQALNVGVYELFSYTRVNRQTKGKSHDMEQIIDLLLSISPKEVKKAKNILMEVFDKN